MPAAALTLILLAVEPSEADREPPVAVFTSPTAVAGALVVSLLTGGCCNNVAPMAFVPLGAAFTAGDIAWAADAALVYSSPRNSVHGFFGLWFAFGPVVHSGQRALNGFFLNPKLTVGAFQVSSPARMDGDGQWMINATVGADAGYQWTLGRFYLAFVLGASVGVGWKEDDNLAGPWLNVSQPFPRFDVYSPVLGLNVQLLRVGYTF